MTDNLSDTQPIRPVNPFAGEAPLTPTIDPEADGRGRGCFVQIVVGGILLLFALAIVALAGLAGWTNGQREGSRVIAATRESAVRAQLDEIPGDVAGVNLIVLDARIRWLATQTPAVAGLQDIMATGTALYFNSLPTATFTPSPTALPSATLEAGEQTVLPTPAGGSYDLAAIMGQAQAAITSSQWEDAIELLDVILAVDPTYQSGQVRTLMSQSLNNFARELYNSGQPAAANLIVARAEEFGTLAEGLSFERYAAELYLTARAGVSTGSQTAVNALNELLGLGAGGRYYTEAQQLLYDAYIRRGDAYVGQGNPCAAMSEYQRAMGVFGSGSANGKYAAAEASCAALSAPTADPNWVLTPGASPPVAPIGVPGS
ncbi:MAG: hypothetical protein L6Q98_02285 [Anaerolineae bacterium]|nr:hypothetical protein [Anaerolineae bacterium]NUQ03032.1 hypothetical protein [Anaerolineae bacterium]